MIRIFTVLLLGLVTLASGQQQGGGQKSSKKIFGQVIDQETQLPLEYASITIFSWQDSSLITGGITDPQGKFSIDIRPGRFYASVQFISYQEQIINDIRIPRTVAEYDLGTISLSASISTLSEIIVTGERDQVEMTLDKRVFNVGQDLSNAGQTAVDILDNVPSVSVDQDGNVSLRGSENVRILIDGKPSGLIGISGSDGLRQLQGDIIENIELVTNPSARYDAEGNAGIINIILKKKRESGFNGAVTLDTGYPHNHGASVNFNYRRDKLNFFGNYGFRYRDIPGFADRFQRFFDDEDLARSDQNLDFERGGISNNVRIGSEWLINENNTLIASYLYRISDGMNGRETFYRDFDAFNEMVSESFRVEEEDEEDINHEYALSYSKNFEKKGRKLTADIQYRENTEDELADIKETVLFSVEDIDVISDQRSENRESEESWLFQMDYIHPLGPNTKFETGYRGNLRNLANDYLVESLISGIWVNETGLSNNFRYDEDVHAAYAIYSNKLQKISYQLGLRVEATSIDIELSQTDESFPKDYTNLFPSAFLIYEIKQGSSLQSSYSHRISRPRSRSLNPFPYSIGDNRNLRTGNPDLDPTFTDSYEVGFLKTWKKATLFSSVYYRRTDGVVQRITTRIDSVNISLPVNLSLENAFGFEFNYSHDLTEWWRMNANANLYRSVVTGAFSDQNFDAEAYSLNTRINSRMTFWKNLEYQMNFRYRAPENRAQGDQQSYYQLDLGLSKPVMKKKGTLVFNVRDVFNSGKYRFTTEDENFVFNSTYQRRPRSFTVSFTYRINQKDFKNGRDRGGRDDFDEDF